MLGTFKNFSSFLFPVSVQFCNNIHCLKMSERVSAEFLALGKQKRSQLVLNIKKRKMEVVKAC